MKTFSRIKHIRQISPLHLVWERLQFLKTFAFLSAIRKNKYPSLVIPTGVERSDLLQIRFLDFGLRPPLEMTVYFSALLQGGDFRRPEAKDTDPPGGNAPNLPKCYEKCIHTFCSNNFCDYILCIIFVFEIKK